MTGKERIGNDKTNFWTYDAETGLVDLSRGVSHGKQLTVQTTTNLIQLNPEASAMIIIDMQNFFVSPAVRPRVHPEEPTLTETAAKALLETGIQAARSHGIRIIWLNWGLTEEDLMSMPPSIIRTFGPYRSHKSTNKSVPFKPGMIRNKNCELYKGLGADLGPRRSWR